MNKNWILRWGISAALLAGLVLVIVNTAFRPPADRVQSGVISLTATPSGHAFEHITGPRPLSFPEDFGPHPGYETEWWYYTGNLETQDGRHFGYQLTFFRRAVMPALDWSPRPSDWGTNQIYLAHFTLTDVDAQQFHYSERFERGAAGLAGSTLDPDFQVWLHDWSVEQVGQNRYRVRAREKDFAIQLDLVDRKGPVPQGDHGYSQKGPQPGNASLYFSQTRLESQGTVTAGGQPYTVSGLSWMDREISTSALSKGQVGWDWFALQLDDGSELMVYSIRRADGTADTFSSGLLIEADGRTRRLAREDFQLTPQGSWTSPHSGGKYPDRWRVHIPALDLDLEVRPLLADQELNVSFIYWEGAVKISGTRAGRVVAGYGYVELTGYAKSMEGTL